MLFVALLIALKLAVLGLHLATTASSSGSVIVVVAVALLGSGGLGYWLDRRNTQASRLAQDAVNATDVFQKSLEEERRRRDELQRDLADARSAREKNSERIAELEAQVEELNAEIDRLNAEIKRLTAEERLRALSPGQRSKTPDPT